MGEVGGEESTVGIWKIVCTTLHQPVDASHDRAGVRIVRILVLLAPALTRSSRRTPSHIAMAAATKTDE